MPRPSDILSIVPPTFKRRPASFARGALGWAPEMAWKMPVGLHMVTAISSRRYKDVVETLAWYFKKEFGYDFVAYTADEDTSDHKVRSFFWTEDDYRKGHRVIGVCTFRLREWRNMPQAYWSLCRIWFHPFMRRSGHLTKAWRFFTEMLGPLDVEHPLSPAMKKFLEGKPHQLVHTTDEKKLEVKLYVQPATDVLDISHTETTQ
jgi:hypothetical protein